MKLREIHCSYCPQKPCRTGSLNNAPSFCPSTVRPDLMEEAKQKFQNMENKRMAQNVARTWKSDEKLTRIEETILYAKLQGYTILGLAFCIGLEDEAELVTNVLVNEGFKVVSICCMCGAFSSDIIELPKADKIKIGRQPMCNPIGQAAMLDAAGCELNIMLGLCVGDDTLFIKHSKAPVTVLAVKDKVLAHNPLGALYASKYYHSRLNFRRQKKDEEKPI